MDLKTYFRERDKVGKTFTEDMMNIAHLTIDGDVISGYGSYSFVRVVEYVTEPTRSQNGQIANLDSYTTFTTPKVRIKFNALSIDGYRLLMQKILSKREFNVGCWDFTYTDGDHPNGRWVHQNMYFYPNDYPEIFQYDLEVLAIMNYEIELIGTNTNNENIVITLNLNAPNSTPEESAKAYISDAFQDEETLLPYPNSFPAKSSADIVSFGGRDYKFVCWNTKPDGSGVSYSERREAKFNGDTTLYAKWYSGKSIVNFVYEIDGEEQVYTSHCDNNEKFVAGTPSISQIRTENGKKVKYEVSKWNFNRGNSSIVGYYPTDLESIGSNSYITYGLPVTRTELS